MTRRLSRPVVSQANCRSRGRALPAPSVWTWVSAPERAGAYSRLGQALARPLLATLAGSLLWGAAAIRVTEPTDDVPAIVRPDPPAPEPLPKPVPERRLMTPPGSKATRGAQGMVVSVSADATRAGQQCLARGGNAADAAIAVAFALAVTHPSAGNLGGGGFAVVHLPTGEDYALDFRESSPSGLERERFLAMVRAGGMGPDSVGIPGSVAGLTALHARFGQTPFRDLIEPARRLASEGHVVSQREARGIMASWDKLRLSEIGKRLWGKQSRPFGPGTRLRLPELARVLERIQAEGKAGFYEGVVAKSVVAALGNHPQITLTDLAQYEAKWRTPLHFFYRGLRLTTMPAPSAGGVALAAGLRLLESYSFEKMPKDSVARHHLLLEVMRRAQADRLYGVVDPDRLTRLERDSVEGEWLDGSRWQRRVPIDPARATRNEDVVDQAEGGAESEQTTHLAVVDARGMAVSLTTTLSSGFGSKVITSTGIVLNNSLGSFSGLGKNTPGPSRRTTSSMAPTLVEDRDGLRLVLGTPGGDSIPSTLLQLVNLLVDYQLPLDAAVDAPRIHQSVHGRGEARSESFHPLAPKTRQALEGMGHRFAAPAAYMGHANSIVLTPDAVFGYVDPREGGLALGVEEPSP